MYVKKSGEVDEETKIQINVDNVAPASAQPVRRSECLSFVPEWLTQSLLQSGIRVENSLANRRRAEQLFSVRVRL